MSYDLYLLRIPPSKDPLAEAKAVFNQDIEEINPGLPEPQKEATKRKLARQLQRINPALEIFQFNYVEIAKCTKISEQEAQNQYRHIELNELDGTNGIQITLYDDTASLTIPYWHEEEKAREVCHQVWQYLECLQSHGSFSTYDPQHERIVNLDKDFEAILKTYSWGVGMSEQVSPEITKSKKPWWKFW